MPVSIPTAAKPWWTRLFTHNPFYVISAVLTLYGLHVSFSDNIDPTRGWMQLQLFLGYIGLLAATGVFIVRFGQVWEDARTLFLLVLLLMVALSISFDRVCLDNEYLGLQFLAVGLGASLLLCECLLRALRVRLPWSYRGVLYLQLAILFGYPVWLGHLSLTDQLDVLAGYTLAFPTLIALSILLLAPAARKRGLRLQDNGTPWRWPMYPWTLLAVLWIGVLLRALSLTFSFDPTAGFHSGFQPYFLIPFLLSVALVVAESCIRQASSRSWWEFVLTPLGLLLLALPGSPGSVAQARYLTLLQESLGSPIQITAILLTVFFAYLVMKRVQTADWGIMASLAVFSVVDHETLDVDTLAEINPVTAFVGILILAGSAILKRSTLRLSVAAAGVMLAISYSLGETNFIAHRAYLPIHLTLVLTALTGLCYDDQLGRFMRRWAPFVLPVAATLSLLTYRHLFPGVPVPWHGLYALCFAGAAATYWLRNRRFQDVAATVTCLAISAGHVAEHYVGATLNLVLLQGKKWIVWGAAFFLAGLLVSVAKGGHIGRMFRAMRQWQWAADGAVDEK